MAKFELRRPVIEAVKLTEDTEYDYKGTLRMANAGDWLVQNTDGTLHPTSEEKLFIFYTQIDDSADTTFELKSRLISAEGNEEE